MPVLADHANVAIRLTSNISIGVRSSASSSTISVSVPAIAGGTAAGVVIALVAVMGWKWWKMIVGQTNKKRQSRKVCFNVPLSLHVFIIHCNHQQNILERSPATSTPTTSKEEQLGSSTDWNNAECSDWKEDLADSLPNTTFPPHTSPNQHSLLTASPALSGPPIKPPRNPVRALRRPSKENAARGSRTSFIRASNRLSYKSSNISTASVYSTQSGEEQQARVPAAVIIAALGHTFGTKRLSTLNHNSEPYTIGEEQAEFAMPRPRVGYSAHSENIRQMHRVSNISAGSLSLQQGSQSIATIGMAYGGEEYEELFHERKLEGLDDEEGSLDQEIARPIEGT